MNRMAPDSNFDAFEPLLKESINRFLAEYEGGSTDFSNFTSIFSRFLQKLPDPPLHIIWFYAALNFHSAKFNAREPSNQVSVAKDLFQLLVSCSSPHNAVKNIAVLAPVISQMSSIAAESSLLRRQIQDLLEGIVSYISICCGEIFHPDEELGGLDSCFMDLVHVWLVGKIGDNYIDGEALRLFLPIASDGVREKLVSERFGVGYVAGIVMCEVFLLKLCLKFGCGIPREELVAELRNCSVQMTTAFRSVYFTDNILRMLLEQVLPVISLLNPADEIFLREVLYDAVISMEYLLLGPQKGILTNGETLRNLAVTWLFFVDNAIRFAREYGDKTKVISYLEAFSESCLPPELVKWVTSQHSTGKELTVPNISTPAALIRWLLITEDQGIKIFDSTVSMTYARNIICKSTIEYELPPIRYDGKNSGDGYLRDSGNVGKQESMVNSDMEMTDSIDNMPSILPGLKALAETNDTRKRREGRNEEVYQPVKLLKCHLTCNSSRERIFRFRNDGLSGDTEMRSPLAVTEIEHMQQ